ncbi:MAG: hypothetical protein JOZ40_02705, partial [Methylobacteriaceae bacterium]|nr:hypothetical protein [Methylobacteriaceae bacterium]
MADYYPLLARAVAGLPTSTPEARRAVYTRAKTALMNQLRGVRPDATEQDLERESRSLDEAVRRLEREYGAAPVRPPMSPGGTAPTARPLAMSPVAGSGERAARPTVARAAAAPSGSVSSDAVDELDPPDAARQLPPHASSIPAPQGESGRPAASQVGAEKSGQVRFWIFLVTIVAVVGVIGVTAYKLRDRPEDLARLKVGPPSQAAPEAGNGKLLGRADEKPAAPTNPVPTVQVSTVPIRPPAPPPGNPAASSDAAPPSPAAAAPAPAPAAPMPGPVASAPVPLPETAPPPAQSTVPPAAEPASPGSPETTPPAAASAPASAPPAPAPAPTPAEAAPPAPAPAAVAAVPSAPPVASSIPVAYRAALLVEAPDDPQRVKTYVGTVIWRNDTASSGQGQPLAVTVRADVDIPEAKLKASMVLQKNTDPAFKASHTLV